MGKTEGGKVRAGRPRRRFMRALKPPEATADSPKARSQSVKSLMRDSVDEIARRSEERRMRPVEGGALD